MKPEPIVRPPPSNAIFDESGHFLIYPTVIGTSPSRPRLNVSDMTARTGIKIVNTVTNVVNVTLGRVENTERFGGVALYQGVPKVI